MFATKQPAEVEKRLTVRTTVQQAKRLEQRARELGYGSLHAYHQELIDEACRGK